MTTRQRIIRALERGPMYEGGLRLVVGAPPDFYDALRTLRTNGAIVRDLPDNPQAWKVAP